MNKKLMGFGALPIVLLTSLPAFSATAINLQHKPLSTLQTFLTPPTLTAQNAVDLTEVSRTVDFNNTTHIRIKETYAGYPVWGGDAILHVPDEGENKTSLRSLAASKKNTSYMNGVLYQNLQKDLENTPNIVFSKSQREKALKKAIELYDKEANVKTIPANEKVELMVYVDKNKKANFAYYIRFYAPPAKGTQIPSKPVYIMDAVTLTLYLNWNDIKTVENPTNPNLTTALAGGFGGNEKMGKIIYDGINSNLSALKVMRDPTANICYLQNKDVLVKKCNYYNSYYMRCEESVDTATHCGVPNAEHNNLYWLGDFDAINGAYSPSNDALFYGSVIKDMYMQWYEKDVLVKNQKAMQLKMIVHLTPLDNAFWDEGAMHFGDGVTTFYPLVSLGVSAHEISHGFTEQHSNLIYRDQSGGINEAFSDMAAQAAEYFAYGKNNWQIAPEIFRAENKALRYMDQPSKDCNMGYPCSIGNAKEYKEGLNVHLSSGVFNRAFYLLATSPGWDTHKAFNVMVKANISHWLPDSTFESAACGVIEATKDYQKKKDEKTVYDIESVVNAFNRVGVDTSNC